MGTQRVIDVTPKRVRGGMRDRGAAHPARVEQRNVFLVPFARKLKLLLGRVFATEQTGQREADRKQGGNEFWVGSKYWHFLAQIIRPFFPNDFHKSSQ